MYKKRRQSTIVGRLRKEVVSYLNRRGLSGPGVKIKIERVGSLVCGLDSYLVNVTGLAKPQVIDWVGPFHMFEQRNVYFRASGGEE